jgi:hypothetical protein
MPRGGPRPGAGARNGNANAMTNMNHSPRALIVYNLLLVYPDKHALAHLLVDNGVPLGRRPLTPRDYRRAVEIIYYHFFDRSGEEQSKAIKQSPPPPGESAPNPEATP